MEEKRREGVLAGKCNRAGSDETPARHPWLNVVEGTRKGRALGNCWRSSAHFRVQAVRRSTQTAHVGNVSQPRVRRPLTLELI